MLFTLFAVLTAPLMALAASGMMDMAHMQMNAHHRCCQHDVWNGMMYLSEGMLMNGSMTPNVTKAMVQMDHDFSMKWERLNISSHNVMTDMKSHVMVWKDYNHMMSYIMTDDGKCTSMMMDPKKEMMQSPCIPGDYMYAGHMILGSGMDTLHIQNWMGMDEMGLQVSLSVTESDCTPVTMNIMGEVNGTKVMTGILFADVTQGMLSSMDAFMLPMACKNAMTMPSVGK